ncbi:hypothetical protein Aduo_006835 [Ancylostoma duodenale]
MNYMNIGFVALLIIGAVIAGVITLVLKPGSSTAQQTYTTTSTPAYKGRVMYFAIHPGDGSEKEPAPEYSDAIEEPRAIKCSLRMNKASTRDSIDAMEGFPIRYSFIIYDATAETTLPLEAHDAKQKLDDIKSTNNKVFNQTSAILEFKKQIGERINDLLVYYIPCRFNYSAIDDDTKSFIKEMEAFRGRIMLASNTHSAVVVAKAFDQKPENVIGNDDDMDISERIKKFGTQDPVTSVSTTAAPSTSPGSAPPATSTVNGNESTSTNVPSSTGENSLPTEVPASTTPSQESTVPTKETSASPTSSASTPSVPPSRSTESVQPSTEETATSPEASTASVPPGPTTESVEPSTEETATSPKASTASVPPSPTTESVEPSTEETATSPEASTASVPPGPTTENTQPSTQQTATSPEASTASVPPGPTTENTQPSTEETATSSETSTASVPPSPTTESVEPSTEETATTPEASTTSVPSSPTSESVQPSTEETATSPEATATTTSEEPVKTGQHCLFAADLLNLGTNSAAYEKEKNFIIKIGETLFKNSEDVSAGIWAYGYSNNRVLTIGNDTMRHNFTDFLEQVDTAMQIQDDATKKIDNNRNDIFVWKKKAEPNQDDEYQKLNMTRNAAIGRIVAVSLKSVDFSNIVIPPVGIAVSASENYSDDDVAKVVGAILQKPEEE